MTSEDFFDQVFSRENVLRGHAPSRRARTILYQIEGLTALQSEQARRAMELFVTDETIQGRELAYIDAYSLGQDRSQAPTIQDLERYAPKWSHLVPDRAELRAAIAHEISANYAFQAQSVTAMREALGLDNEAVRSAYQQFYGQPLDTIYQARVSIRERARWAWGGLGRQLDGLPQFWSVFAMTLTETVGASLLALPIALAGIGPLPGILFLLVFGVANVLTVGYMAESAARSGEIRYGNGFVGQMVSEYLGRGGSVLLSISMLVLCLLAILAFYVGFATTLTEASGVPPAIWVVVLYAIGLYFVTRGSINATVTLALVVGAINLVMILVLVLLTVPHVRLEYVTFANFPLLGGGAFDSSILGLVFGVIFAAFFGHLSVPNSARMVLRRDPSGRSLIRGAMAAQVTAIIINSIWVLVVNGSIPPEVLAGESGTSLIPLARTVGPAVYVFGTVFVVLGLGIVSIHLSLGLYNLTREWLPKRQGVVITLPRRQGRLRLFSPGKTAELPQFNLVYLGLEDAGAQFRLDIETGAGVEHIDLALEEPWQATQTLAAFTNLTDRQRRIRLSLQRLSADSQSATVRIVTELNFRYVPEWDRFGLSTTDILALPEDQAEFMSWLVREGQVNLEQVALHLKLSQQRGRAFLQPMIDQGYVKESKDGQGQMFEARLTATRSYHLPAELVEAVAGSDLATPASKAAGQAAADRLGFGQRLLDLLFSDRGRFLLALAPVTLVFLTTQILLLTGNESFSGPLSFIGVVVIAMLAGVFPVLLLRATRPGGDSLPSFFYRWIGHPILLVAIFLLSLTGIVLHGLFIWEDLPMRIAALVVSVLIIIMTINSWRRGSFLARLVAILRAGPADGAEATLTIAYNGQPLETTARFTSADGQMREEKAALFAIGQIEQLSEATVELPATGGREIKLWAHRLSEDGESKSLAVTAGLDSDPPQTVRLSESEGHVILPLDGQAKQLVLLLDERGKRPS